MPKRSRALRRRRRKYKAPLPLVVSNRHYCRLRIYNTISLNPVAAGNAAFHKFRANSLFDYDLTGIGAQPNGFDELAALYNEYHVLSTKLDARVVSVVDQAVTQATWLGITFAHDPAITTVVPEDWIEQRRTRKILNAGSGSGSAPRITHAMGMKKFFSVAKKDDLVSEPDYGAQVTTNPAQDCTAYLWIAPADGVSDLVSRTIYVQTEFMVCFSDPKNLTQS